MKVHTLQARGSMMLVAALLFFSAVDLFSFWPARVHAIPLLAICGALWLIYIAVMRIFFAGDDSAVNTCGRMDMRYCVFSITLLGLLAVYYLNPTHRWVDGVGLLPVKNWRFLPGSAYPVGTLNTLYVSAVALVVLGCSMRMSPGGVRALMAMLIMGGSVLAIVVGMQRLTPRPFPVYEVTGIFASENHYAAWANLVLPLALAAGARIQYNAFQSGKLSNPSIFFYGLAALLAGSIFLSRSRAGLLITVLLIVTFFLWQVQLRRRHPFIAPPLPFGGRLLLLLVLSSVVLVLLAATVAGWERFDHFAGEVAFRWWMISDSLRIWGDRPWWGSGPGSYAAVIPYYQSSELARLTFSHAHHEPAQFLAEYGVIGAAIIVISIWSLCRSSSANVSHSDQTPAFCELEAPAFFMAMAGCLLHGLVDFPFRLPLIYLTFCAYAGIWIAGRGVHR